MLSNEGVMVTLEVKVGRISAVCPVCGGTAFRAPKKRPKSMDVLTCVACVTKFTYVFLLQQIAEKP
jgi:hypothetical protein